MIYPPPGDPGVTPQVAAPAEQAPVVQTPAPENTGTLPVAAPVTGDDGYQPDVSPAPQPVPTQQPVVQQPAAPREPVVDPAIVPWVQQAAGLLNRQQQVDGHLGRLQAEQSAADRVVERAIQRAQTAEEQAAIAADYRQERAQREAEYARLNGEKANLQREDLSLGRDYATWQRERAMEPMAEYMAQEFLVRQAAQANPAPDFPAQELRAYLAGFPPNAQVVARDKWVADYQRNRLTNRAASNVDRMGPAGTGAGIDYSQYSGKDLIQQEIERMISR